MGSLDSLKSFNDYISTQTDLQDDYEFSVSSTRTLFAAFSETDNGVDPRGAISFMDLYNDRNHDGVAEPDELITGTQAGLFEPLLLTVNAGQYILRVQAGVGGGTYTLSAEARPDQAGNTLGTAKNLGTINGLTHLDDYLNSAADPVDFYKFTASAAGTIGAAVAGEFGTSADLTLIRDANNNGIIDKGDILASAVATGVGDKELTKSISAGTYFLRVSLPGMATLSKYDLAFHTDYAGGTVGTARNVGTLGSATLGFDDWASGPFGGAISDRNDLYKLTLASARKFTAKLTGTLSGEDLKLILYRDKNNDGKLTDDEIITLSDVVNSPNELITRQLAAGTYYVRVWGVNGETNYHLALTAS
jgi:hypothetical protein